VFVLAPVIFSLKVFSDVDAVARSFVAFGLYCLAAGAVYLVNDVLDRTEDKLHPIKRNRPIASGALPLTTAIHAATTLVAVVLAGGFFLDHRIALVLFGYLALNLLYSKVLKRVAFIDVMAIALGFVLRVVGGGLAANAPVSDWLVLCTLLLAMFLGFGKRRHELTALASGGQGASTRAVLERYPLPLLDVALILTASATIVAYTLYTRDPHTVATFGTDRLWWSAPLIATGIGRFVWLIRRERPRSPTEQMLRDPPFLMNMALWVALMGWLISPG
jgi:4-hydroxybenzoate polyprenyltransferase